MQSLERAYRRYFDRYGTAPEICLGQEVPFSTERVNAEARAQQEKEALQQEQNRKSSQS